MAEREARNAAIGSASYLQFTSVDELTHSDMVDALGDSTAALFFFLSRLTSGVFVVAKGLQVPRYHRLDFDAVTQAVEPFVDHINRSAMEERTAEWHTELSKHLQNISTALGMSDVVTLLGTPADDYVPSNIKSVVLLPHLSLHRVPLDTLPIEGHTHLADMYTEGCFYAPSLRIFGLSAEHSAVTPPLDIAQLFARTESDRGPRRC